MDVRCERCSTEYEFDDALVSGRGTTVKCTNCGHKFKIRRSDGDFSEDFWNVQTGDGRTLVFTSLRELQRAIQTNLVDRNDLLSRGGLKQKAIGQIPELAPFFDQRDQRRSAPPPVVGAPTASAARSAASAAPAPKATSRPPPPPGASAPPLVAPPRQRMSTRPDFPPQNPEPSPTSDLSSMKKTLMGTGTQGQPAAEASPPVEGSAPPPPPPPVAAAPVRRSEAPPTEREPEPDTERFARARQEQAEANRSPSAAPPVASRPLTRTQPIDPVYVPRHSPAPPAFEASSPLPPPTEPVLRTMNVDMRDSGDFSDGVRGRSPSLSDAPGSMGRRRSVGGYIVAAVVVAGAGLIAAVWAKDHLGGVLDGSRGSRPTVAAADPRVVGLLASGEKALADGNLETAKESFDKASALAEKDAHVLLDVARLAAIRADVPWLKSRLLAADAADDVRITKDMLAELSAAARKAADEAIAVAPDDPAALRTKIDALRIAGDRDGARALVAKVAPSASQPETAYVLAALDLAENEPLWSTVIERLRAAASAESGPGRARATLVYALARSGDVVGAKAEVEHLAGMQRQHPLLPLLRGFADRAKPSAKLDGGAPDLDGGMMAFGADAGRKGPRDRGDRGDPAAHPGGDSRQLVADGEKARQRGDNDRAQSLFAAALDRNPNDTEALNGLAAIAHSRRDLNGARASYKRVLSINPSYVPALVGVADVDWESGDRGSAMKTYKEIVERFPEGSYPARVKQRVDAASGGGSSSSGSSGSTGSSGSGAAGSSGAAPPTTATPTPADTGGGG
ncbi:MAG: hypothetical protein QOI41_4638 [Myxococcales bacterium]|nr:hypothetical protein [Myxococcales bacterium]